MTTSVESDLLSARRSFGPRPGFTLVELLAVIAIIAVLLGLLLPAVNGVRNAARQTQCTNNMKQLITGMQGYESANGILPSLWGVSPLPGSGQPWGSWINHIFPYIDMQAAYDRLPRNVVNIVVETRWAVVTSGSVFCESRTQTNVGSVFNQMYNTGTLAALVPSLPVAQCPGDPVQSQFATGMGLQPMLLGNYFFNAWIAINSEGRSSAREQRSYAAQGSSLKVPCGAKFNNANRIDRTSWVGTFGWHTYELPMKLTSIRDGLANTIFLAEGMRVCNEDRRRCNAGYSTCGNGYRESFRFAFYGNMVDQNDQNIVNHTYNFGWITNFPSPAYQTGYGNTLMFQSSPSIEQADPWRMQAMHGQALPVAMGDGSVKTIQNNVSYREASNPDGPAGNVDCGCAPRTDGVWDLLMLPCDRQPIPGDAL